MLSHQTFSIKRIWVIRFLLGLSVSIAGSNVWPQSSIHFADVAASKGLSFLHSDGGDADPFLPALMATGLAILDFDGDGWEDVYFLNNHSLNNPNLPRHGNALFRNLGDGNFVDVSEKAGVRDFGFALGVVAADVDHDGDQDLLISNFGPPSLLLNNGDGTFFKAPNVLSTKNDTRLFGAGIACLDIDNDGLLDIFLATYVDFSIERYVSIAPKSFPYPPGPKDFAPLSDLLFRNLGDGNFQDISRESNIAASPGPSMGVICGDWDHDNDVDIFVCSDASPNQLFVNDGRGRFEERGVLHGVAFDVTGNANGSMGVDAGDIDGDGWEDLLVTNYTDQLPELFRNVGSGIFEDISRSSRIGREVLPHTNWGVGLFDVDNDRDLDAFFANGHFLKNIENFDRRTSYRVANTLMLNSGKSRFTDTSKSSGPGLTIAESSRGAAFGDLDRDGDLDVVLLNANAPASYLQNQTTPKGNWLQCRLVGTECNRDAIGARVAVQFNDGSRIWKMIHAGRGYQSHYGNVLHFGLGDAKQIAKLSIIWPGGKTREFDSVSINTEYLFVENNPGLVSFK